MASFKRGPDGEDGLVFTLALNVTLDMEATTTFQPEGLNVPAEAMISPTFSTQTYARVKNVDFSTTYLIGKNAIGPLNVAGKNFPSDSVILKLIRFKTLPFLVGEVEFEGGGIPLPFSLPAWNNRPE